MIAQSVRNDPDDPLKRIISCSIQFYGRKIVVEPTWHPWFGPVFVSADEYAPAGISPLIIPTPIALEHGNRTDMLCMEEGLERIMTETKIRMIEQLPDTIKEYRIDPPMIDNSKHNLQNAQSNTTKLLWINVRYWSRSEEHVEENPVSAMIVQTIQKTKYGLTVGRER